MAKHPCVEEANNITDFANPSYPSFLLAQGNREKTREKILAAIAQNKEITTQELAEQIGVTQKGIEWQIRNLKTQGLLERVGPDSGGHWKIVTDND